MAKLTLSHYWRSSCSYRVRIALGSGSSERVRAGVALAPALRQRDDGASRLRIGEGVEYGIVGRQPAGMSVAGYRVGGTQRSPDGRRQNISTLGWVAIGVGTVVVVGIGVMGWLIHEASENTE